MLEETPWLQLCPLNNGPRGPFSSSDRHHDVQCLCSASHLSLLLGTRWKLQKLGQSLATPLLCSQTYHTDSRKVHPPVPADGLSVCPHPTNKNLGEVIGHLCSLVTCHCACHFGPSCLMVSLLPLLMLPSPAETQCFLGLTSNLCPQIHPMQAKHVLAFLASRYNRK